MRKLLGILLALFSTASLLTTASAFKTGKPTNAGMVTVASSDASALQISPGSGNTVGWVTATGNGMLTFDLTRPSGAGPYLFDTSAANRVNNLIRVTNPTAVNRSVTVSVATSANPTAYYTPVPASFPLAAGASQEISFDVTPGPGGVGPDAISIVIASN